MDTNITEQQATMYPPITDCYNKMKAFMEKDPEVHVELDYEGSLITVSVDNAAKATAWRIILPESKTMGNITFNIDVEDASDGAISTEVFETALSGNSEFVKLKHVVVPALAIDRYFAYMKPEVIQFANDNFGSPEGLETRTAEDLAREVAPVTGINYCSYPVETI